MPMKLSDLSSVTIYYWYIHLNIGCLSRSFGNCNARENEKWCWNSALLMALKSKEERTRESNWNAMPRTRGVKKQPDNLIKCLAMTPSSRLSPSPSRSILISWFMPLYKNCPMSRHSTWLILVCASGSGRGQVVGDVWGRLSLPIGVPAYDKGAIQDNKIKAKANEDMELKKKQIPFLNLYRQ